MAGNHKQVGLHTRNGIHCGELRLENMRRKRFRVGRLRLPADIEAQYCTTTRLQVIVHLFDEFH